jgi:hypothetical protein
MNLRGIALFTITCAAVLFCFGCEQPVEHITPPDCVGTWEGADQQTTWGLRDVVMIIDADSSWECLYYEMGTDTLLEYSARGTFMATVRKDQVNLAYATERFYSGDWHATDESETPIVVWYELSNDDTEMLVEISDPRPTNTVDDVYTLTKVE